MAQFAVISVAAIPTVGGTTGAVVYRGDHADAAAAVDAAVAIWQPAVSTKMWVVPVGSLTQYRVDASRSYSVVLE
jgi:hypothetical protein